MKTYRKTEMGIVGWNTAHTPLFETSIIHEETTVSEEELGKGFFDYEYADDEETSIMDAGKLFLEQGEVGQQFRWLVDPMSMEYCELRRLS